MVQHGAKMGYDGPTWDQDEAKMGATSQRCVAQRLRVESSGGQRKRRKKRLKKKKESRMSTLIGVLSFFI